MIIYHEFWKIFSARLHPLDASTTSATSFIELRQPSPEVWKTAFISLHFSCRYYWKKIDFVFSSLVYTYHPPRRSPIQQQTQREYCTGQSTRCARGGRGQGVLGVFRLFPSGPSAECPGHSVKTRGARSMWSKIWHQTCSRGVCFICHHLGYVWICVLKTNFRDHF